jgi:hypothetical protein
MNWTCKLLAVALAGAALFSLDFHSRSSAATELNLGVEAFNKTECAEAILHLKKAVSLDPENLIPSFLFAQTTAADAGKNETIRPVSVGQQEVRDHLLGDWPFLRISLPMTREAILLSMMGIAVHLTVNPRGAVTSAVADKKLSADIRSQAEAVARSLRYRPF